MMAVTVPSLCFLRIGWDQQLITHCNRFVAHLYLHLNRTLGGHSLHKGGTGFCQAVGHKTAMNILA